jgi:hypothetical protein
MPIPDAIAAIRALRLDENEQRWRIYELKTTALLDAAQDLIGRNLTHAGYQFRINRAEMTDQPALFLDVTFTRPPAQPVTHQITIVNPPVLPAARTGNERKDLIQALHEMLEGFV